MAAHAVRGKPQTITLQPQPDPATESARTLQLCQKCGTRLKRRRLVGERQQAYWEAKCVACGWKRVGP